MRSSTKVQSLPLGVNAIPLGDMTTAYRPSHRLCVQMRGRQLERAVSRQGNKEPRRFRDIQEYG